MDHELGIEYITEFKNQTHDDTGETRLGLSTVPYMAMAIPLTVSIRPRAVPYPSCIHGFKFPRQYSTVFITAGIRVKTVVRVKVK
jgi:hypothetical protein